MPYKSKSEFIKSEVTKFTEDDSKHLNKLVVSQIGVQNLNPMLECDSDHDLAEQCAEFFITKIQKTREDLAHHPPFSPPVNNVTFILESFTKLSELEVRRLVSKLLGTVLTSGKQQY